MVLVFTLPRPKQLVRICTGIWAKWRDREERKSSEHIKIDVEETQALTLFSWCPIVNHLFNWNSPALTRFVFFSFKSNWAHVFQTFHSLSNSVAACFAGHVPAICISTLILGLIHRPYRIAFHSYFMCSLVFVLFRSVFWGFYFDYSTLNQ